MDTTLQLWNDGILNKILRKCCTTYEPENQYWITFDGPVQNDWIENLNTVLDDTKMLSLANSERIKLNQNIKFFFECDNLLHASPATVSRLGIVYVEKEMISVESILN